MRPVLVPSAPRGWRDPSTLQVGVGSSRAVLVEGLRPPDRTVLALLDGVRTWDQVVADARAAGCTDPEAVLTVLDSADLLVDADALFVTNLERAERDRFAPDLASLTLVRGCAAPTAVQARRAARVVVHGAGRVGAPLAALLSGAGIGTLDVRDVGPARPADVVTGGVRSEDVGRPRGSAVAGRLSSARSTERPALVVLTDDAPPEILRVLTRDAIPHLVATVDGHVGVVGPLVLDGRGPCVGCVALVRTEVDPAWPMLTAQRAANPVPVEACDGVLAVAVAAQAAMQALQLVDGQVPASLGGSLELELPDWRWRRRTWPAHPACECSQRVSSAA